LVHKECARRHQEQQFSRPSFGSVDNRGMNSRVHPNHKTRYRVTNWSEYDQALVKRGNITLWITPLAIKGWAAKPTGRRGAPQKYSNLAIETALTLRLLFQLPLRQAEGFLRSLLELMDLSLEAPDHTTLSRRSSALDVDLGVLQSKRPMHLIIDSTGLSIVGEGEWAAAKHGGGGKRGWRKLHLGVDADGCIRTQVLTKSNVDDVTPGIKIIKATKGKLNRVTADAAYDSVGFYDAAGARGARVVVPPSLSASVSGRGLRTAERDRTIRKVEKLGRREWKKRSGYQRQGTVENGFYRYKTILGDKLYARGLSTQKAEARIGCRILNRLLDCGRPRSVAIAR
jgi:IS5 family transposase